MAGRPGEGVALPKIIPVELPEFSQIALPYDFYSEADLAHRVVYVEASRGCPFTCEFCLSSLDIPVRAVPLETFLAEMQKLQLEVIPLKGEQIQKLAEEVGNVPPAILQRVKAIYPVN